MLNYLRGIFAAAAVVALVASTVYSVPLSSDQAKCQKTVATQGRVFFKKRFKALQKCQDDINKGTLAAGTDCTMNPKAAGKVTLAETKFTQKVTDKCSDALVAALGFGGQCFGVATSAALSACLIQEHSDGVDDLLALVYPDAPAKACEGGSSAGASCTTDVECPLGACVLPGRSCDDGSNAGGICDEDADCPGGACLPSKDQAKCSKILGKTLSKHVNKRMALIQKCKKLVASGKLAANTDCVADSQAKLDGLRSKSIAKIQKKCPNVVAMTELFGSSCAGADLADSVAACSLCEADSAADDLVVVQHGSAPSGALASLIAISDSADCVEGPNSRCRVGDYLMSNSKIRVVVQDIQRNYLAGIGQFGGQIIDADLVRTSGADRDNFEEWAVSLNIEATAHYTSLSIVNDGSDGSPAILRATGVDDLLDLINPSSVIGDFGFFFPPTVDDFDIPVTVQTDYTLGVDDSFVDVETTVTNTDGSPLSIYFGEFLNGSGQVEIFQYGYGFGETLLTAACAAGNTTCNRLSNMVAYSGELDADGVSYAYVSKTPGSSTFTTAGVSVPQLGVDVLLALIGFAPPNFTFAASGQPGDSMTFARTFIVGDGSVSSLVDIRNAAECQPFGTITGVVDVAGSPVSGADIAVLGSPSDAPNFAPFHPAPTRNVVTHTRTDASGAYSLTVPPGSYNIVANIGGHPYEGGGSTPIEHSVMVAAFTTMNQNITLPDTGTLRVTVADGAGTPIAARISAVGFDPSPDPLVAQNHLGVGVINTGVFGDQSEDGRPFGVALATYADDSGDTGDLDLEPGSYRIVASHGTEYSIDFADVTVTAGATTTFNAVLEHVIDTTGFISGDFHVHAIDSPDSAISRVDRVEAMLGEGVDFFAATDHGYRADFSSTISDLGVTGLISTAVGQEITTFDYGHFNAWPLDHDPLLPNHGFVDHGGAAPDGLDYPSAGNYSETPATISALAHADYSGGSNTVQINHIHSHFGLDGGTGLAIDTGVEPPVSAMPGAARRLDPLITNYFSPAFDGLEVWIGDSRGQVDTNFLGQNAGNWFNLMNQGIVMTGVADSDTHRRFLTQSGFPRNMVASLEDVAGALDQDAMSANVNAGRVVGTNGPMIRITAHAVSTGESGGLDLGRCTGVVACTDTSTCAPCTNDGQCGMGETCTALPTLISTTDGAVDITVDVQSPTWAPFDKIEFFVNTTTTKNTDVGVEVLSGVFVDIQRYTLNADFTHTDGAEFTVVSVPAGTSASRLEASTTLNLTGLTEDTWVAVMVSGTDNVSVPLFPVVPNSLDTASNTTLADLIDGNLNESGITARAFTNPVFIDVDGVGGWTAPGVQVAP